MAMYLTVKLSLALFERVRVLILEEAQAVLSLDIDENALTEEQKQYLEELKTEIDQLMDIFTPNDLEAYEKNLNDRLGVTMRSILPE